MTITISAGVTSSGLTVTSGEALVVLSRGKVEASTILSGGSATLSSGAVGSSLTVGTGGVLAGQGDLAGYTQVYGAVSGLTVVDSPVPGGSFIGKATRNYNHIGSEVGSA
jgi:hypothetical protein